MVGLKNYDADTKLSKHTNDSNEIDFDTLLKTLTVKEVITLQQSLPGNVPPLFDQAALQDIQTYNMENSIISIFMTDGELSKAKILRHIKWSDYRDNIGDFMPADEMDGYRLILETAGELKHVKMNANNTYRVSNALQSGKINDFLIDGKPNLSLILAALSPQQVMESEILGQMVDFGFLNKDQKAEYEMILGALSNKERADTKIGNLFNPDGTLNKAKIIERVGDEMVKHNDQDIPIEVYLAENFSHYQTFLERTPNELKNEMNQKEDFKNHYGINNEQYNSLQALIAQAKKEGVGGIPFKEVTLNTKFDNHVFLWKDATYLNENGKTALYNILFKENDYHCLFNETDEFLDDAKEACDITALNFIDWNDNPTTGLALNITHPPQMGRKKLPIIVVS